MEFNFEKEIKCVCGTIFENNDFNLHIKKCELFRETFTEFDDKISKFIKSHSNPKEQLVIIKFILENTTYELDINEERKTYINEDKYKIVIIEIKNEDNLSVSKESFIKSLEEKKKENGNNNLENDKSKKINDYEKMFSIDNINKK